MVQRIPDGTYEASSVYDDDSVNPDEPIRIHSRVTVAGSDMTIDLSGCSQQRIGGVNSRTLAGARVAYKALTEPAAPVNEGSFRALTAVIPEGNVMMARYPAPMGGWSLIVPTVVDTIFKALAPAIPDRIPAAHHGLLGGSIVFLGRDPKTGSNFVLQSLEGGGWGGRPTGDGESASVSVCQGNVKNSPIESMEIKTPVIVEERSLRPRLRRRRALPRRSGHRRTGAQSRGRQVELGTPAPAQMSALGSLERQRRRRCGIFPAPRRQ